MPKISQFPAQTGASVANGDLFPIVDVGSPNVSEYITADELAQIPQLTSRYAPIADRIFITAGSFNTRTGSPTLSSVFNATAWYLDASTDEAVSAQIILPAHWATFDVTGYFVNTAATSGDIVVGANIISSNVDATVSSSAPSSWQTVTVGLAGVLKSADFGSGISATNLLCVINVRRDADAVGDTLANDVGFLGVLVTRAS